MTVPLLDLKAQWAKLGPEIMTAIQPTLDGCGYILGAPVKQLEHEIAGYCGAEFGVGCGNGSDAIVLALWACGVGPGDEVILPSFTFFATAGAVARVGATPVFCDCDYDTFNITAEHIKPYITAKTKAIIPVHLFGQCCLMDDIVALAKEHNLKVIEDAAQSIGAKYKGNRVGQTGGDIVTFSFYPSKNLSALGDGGMCVTNCSDMAEKMTIMRVHGSKPKYYHKFIGMNSRLDSIQAAALSVKLKYLEEWHVARQANGAFYERNLANTPGLLLPVIHPDCWSVYNQFTLRVTNGKRKEILEGLKERKIGFEVYYPVPLHKQECFAYLPQVTLPISEKLAEEVFSIPIYPELTDTLMLEVVHAIKDLI